MLKYTSCSWYFLFIVIIMTSIIEIHPTFAENINLNAFGHKVEIYGELGEQKLVIDGRPTLTNWSLNIESTAIVGGIGILIGTSNSGGNACDVSPFVVSFPDASPPRIDGPLENCSEVKFTIGHDNIRFETPALAGQNGKFWICNPENGFSDAKEKHFVTIGKNGWIALRERLINHPSNLLKYDDLNHQISELLGNNKQSVLRYINGVGSGDYNGDSYIGSACVPHMCTIMEVIIYADIRRKKFYIAWKPESKPIVVRPKVKEWPHSARLELRNWAHKWR